jgi:hypothetical protein
MWPFFRFIPMAKSVVLVNSATITAITFFAAKPLKKATIVVVAFFYNKAIKKSDENCHRLLLLLFKHKESNTTT